MCEVSQWVVDLKALTDPVSPFGALILTMIIVGVLLAASGWFWFTFKRRT